MLNPLTTHVSREILLEMIQLITGSKAFYYVILKIIIGIQEGEMSLEEEESERFKHGDI